MSELLYISDGPSSTMDDDGRRRLWIRLYTPRGSRDRPPWEYVFVFVALRINVRVDCISSWRRACGVERERRARRGGSIVIRVFSSCHRARSLTHDTCRTRTRVGLQIRRRVVEEETIRCASFLTAHPRVGVPPIAIHLPRDATDATGQGASFGVQGEARVLHLPRARASRWA